MKKITAKFKSKCAQTGRSIAKGEEMIYDYNNKRCYSWASTVWHNYITASGEMSDEAKLVRAQEEAYYDNLSRR